MAYFDDNDDLICSYTCVNEDTFHYVDIKTCFDITYRNFTSIKWSLDGQSNMIMHNEIKTYHMHYEICFRTSSYQSSSTIITLILSFVEKVLFKADKI